jgi:alkanesulfonate monooxygenase SsuD/methylene tetrahydromethanopterin reductase-like flavin-dependent oxidoreductase (luciferase family)
VERRGLIKKSGSHSDRRESFGRGQSYWGLCQNSGGSTACGATRPPPFVSLAKRENLTVRQLAQIAGSFSGLTFVGAPAAIADEMEQWLFEEGCDGFNIMFPYVPEGLEDFVDKVVPELQRRGLFQREYEGKTLRENLGLPRPENQFFTSLNDRSSARPDVAPALRPLDNG